MIQLVTYLVLIICAKMTINLSKLILKGIEYHHPEFIVSLELCHQIKKVSCKSIPSGFVGTREFWLYHIK